MLEEEAVCHHGRFARKAPQMAGASRPSAGGRRITEWARTGFVPQSARAGNSRSRHALGRPEGRGGVLGAVRSRGAVGKPPKSSHGGARARLGPAVRERTAYAVSLCHGSASLRLALRALRGHWVCAKQEAVCAPRSRGKLMAMASNEPRSHEPPNPSIEGTFQRPLRALWPAPHVKR